MVFNTLYHRRKVRYKALDEAGKKVEKELVLKYQI